MKHTKESKTKTLSKGRKLKSSNEPTAVRSKTRGVTKTTKPKGSIEGSGKWKNEILVNLGTTATGEKTRIKAFFGFQLLEGKRTHEKPSFIEVKQLDKGGVFITIGLEAKLSIERLAKYITKMGGMEAAQTMA
jgi:hypothetical protein